MHKDITEDEYWSLDEGEKLERCNYPNLHVRFNVVKGATVYKSAHFFYYAKEFDLDFFNKYRLLLKDINPLGSSHFRGSNWRNVGEDY